MKKIYRWFDRVLLILVLFVFSHFVLATELHESIQQKDIENIRTLINEGVDVNEKDENGNAPLNMAIHWRQPDVVSLLFRSEDLDIEVTGQNGFNPLHEAIHSNQLNIVSLLVDKGADLSALTEGGFTPLEIAIYWDRPEIASFLIEKGAKKRNFPERLWDSLDFLDSLF